MWGALSDESMGLSFTNPAGAVILGSESCGAIRMQVRLNNIYELSSYLSKHIASPLQSPDG
jgi:hypothetical protein